MRIGGKENKDIGSTTYGNNEYIQKPSVAMEMTVLNPVKVPK